MIKSTGNVEEDFRGVQKILEETKIFEKKYLKEKPQIYPKNGPPETIRSVHQLEFKGETIEAIFAQDIKTGSVFLQNAYLVDPK